MLIAIVVLLVLILATMLLGRRFMLWGLGGIAAMVLILAAILFAGPPA